MENVIVELIVAANLTGAALMQDVKTELPLLNVDENYKPIEMVPSEQDAAKVPQSAKVIVIRGAVEESDMAKLKQLDKVLHVWTDGKAEAF